MSPLYSYLFIYTTILLLLSSEAFFLFPWLSPRNYVPTDSVDVMAVKMTSNIALLTYDYYSLRFCEPPHGIEYSKENIGELLRGDRDVVIPIDILFLRDMQCRVICKKSLSPVDTSLFVARIGNEYFVQLMLDELPVITKFLGPEGIYDLGYKIGFVLEDRYYINNHLDLTLKYHQSSIPGEYRVVGFSVKPSSVSSSHYDNASLCVFPEVHAPQELTPEESNQVIFSYSVRWVQSEASWSSRWDLLLRPRHKKVHWFSVVNSLAIVLLLSGVVAAILVKVLRRDISHYNRICDELSDCTFDETGWKLVYGDVFRPPKHSFLLTVLLGSGVQLFCTILVVFLLACIGFLSPDNKGGLLTFSIVVYMFLGSVGGYMAGRFYKTMGGVDSKLAAIATASFFPTVVFLISSLVNLLLISKHSSQAMPLHTIAVLLSLWGCISLPLVYLGFHLGYRKQRYEHAVRTNVIPRLISEQPTYLSVPVSALVSGMLPFGAVFLEFYFVLAAIWEHHFYYLFGFLFLVFLIFSVSTCQVAIINTYLLLCNENHHWWWRSSFVLSIGFTAYVFVFIFLFHYTRVGAVSISSLAFYWGYSAVILLTLWLISGTMGLYSSYAFVRKIYSAIKID